VFCIELIILNWNSGDEDAEASISASVSTGDEPGSDEQEKTDPIPSGLTDGESPSADTESPVDQSEEPLGQRYDMPIRFSDLSFVIYAQAELFGYTVDDQSWFLSYKGGGTAVLEVALHELPPGGIDELAEYYLEPYLDGGFPSVEGDRQIGDSSIRGIFVHGTKEEETYEMWVYGPTAVSDPETGVEYTLAAVFVINYENETQKNDLYAVLDTLDLVSGQGEA